MQLNKLSLALIFLLPFSSSADGKAVEAITTLQLEFNMR